MEQAVIPSLMVAMCQDEAEFATSAMSNDHIRSPTMVALTFISGPRSVGRRRGWNKGRSDAM